MRTQIILSTLLILVVITAGSCSSQTGQNQTPRDTAGTSDSNSLRIAVVTGGHAFDVPNFYRLYRELPGIDAYPQHLEHLVDEGYVLHGEYDGEGTILLTTDHQDAMPQVAWARQHGDCRIVCLTLGHDDQAWTNPGFREVLRRSIVWSADPSDRAGSQE
jgi:hypothetical protein